MHRFFVPPSWVQGNEVTITGLQAHQIARVLRMHPGDVVIVLDNSGWEIEVRLVAVDPAVVKGEIVHRRLASGEPRTKISLYQGVLKSNRFEFVLQKGTELGIVQFVPIIADRCVVSDLEAVERKGQRWAWIVQEAAEQCRRGRKPALHPAVLFPQACEQARHSGGLSLIPWEEERALSLRDLLRSGAVAPGTGAAERRQPGAAHWPPFTIHLFVGPEGGFTPQEITIARRYGLVPVTLGRRILRAETAGLVAATAILYELGDLG
jgi:16S rRNA (uracil1498-N3)-methyltransferase